MDIKSCIKGITVLAAAMAAVMGTAAHADYDFKEIYIGYADGIAQSAELFSDNIINIWNTTYSGANLNSHTYLLGSYDISSGISQETKPYIYEDIEGSENKVRFLKRSVDDTSHAYENYSDFTLVDKDGNEIEKLDDYKPTTRYFPKRIGIYNTCSVYGGFSCEMDKTPEGYGYHVYDAYGRDIFGKGYYFIHQIEPGRYLAVPYDRSNIRYSKDEFSEYEKSPDLYLLTSDTVNRIYNTRVRTRINGAEIPCYAADGYCVIKAEDLRGYGFDVIWNGEERRLDISRNSDYVKIDSVPVPPKGASGAPYTDVYASDIKAYCNGNEVKSYQIDGCTLIRPESIEADGISFSYNDENGILDISVEGLERQ